MKKHLRNNNGWAMALVVVLLAVIPIFVVAIYTYSMTSTKLVLKQIELERARYLARSGMEGAVYVWQDAGLDAKPTGNLERVYLRSDGIFALQSVLGPDDIAASLGYVDVAITFNNDENSDEYLTTKILAFGHANDTGSKMTATSLPYMDGDSTGWYNDISGEFEPSNGDRSKTINHPKPATITYFDLEGVVTCDANNPFTFKDGETGILVDTLFFNDPVDLTIDLPTANSVDKLVFITAKKVIFRGNIYLTHDKNPDGSTKEYESLILYAASINAIEIDVEIGEDTFTGKYGAVYFGGDVILDTGVSNVTIIPAGSKYYYKAGGNGVDLIQWHNGYYDSGIFVKMPSAGDENAFTPTEASSIYFVYE